MNDMENKKTNVLFVYGSQRNNNYGEFLKKIESIFFTSKEAGINIKAVTDSEMIKTLEEMKADDSISNLSCIVLDENFVPNLSEFSKDKTKRPIGGPHPGVFEHEDKMLKEHKTLCDKIDGICGENDIKIFAFGGLILPVSSALNRCEYIFTKHSDRDYYMIPYLCGASGSNYYIRGQLNVCKIYIK